MVYRSNALDAAGGRTGSELKARIAQGKPYLGEEEVFFGNEKILALVKRLMISAVQMKIRVIEISDAYVRGVAERQTVTFNVRKGMVIILEGKYANREEMQPYLPALPPARCCRPHCSAL